MEIVFLT